MNRKLLRLSLGILCLLLWTLRAGATVYYVNANNALPVSPFTTWATAATNIQNAIDAAAAGDFVVVSNGTYAVGGRAVYGFQTNRVTIDKAITVQSLSGPNYTTIAGTTSGPRCVYLTNGAVLLGFTLANGGAAFSGESVSNQNGGGAWCEGPAAMLSNCVLSANSALNSGGGAYSGTLVNCTIKANMAHYGAGAYNGTLVGCSVSNNAAYFDGGGALRGSLTNCFLAANNSPFGGGACSNVLINCTLNGNWASKSGGGAYACTLTNCLLTGNFATNGGGATYGILTGCTLTNNWAGNGGAACSNSLNNCLLINNVAGNNGAGAFYGNLINCQLSQNYTFTGFGGGSYGANLTNCIVCGNHASMGGGMAMGTGSSCLIASNSAAGGVFGNTGGGGYSNTLFNCVITVNSNGGSYGGILNRCWITWNGAGGSQYDVLNNCIVSYNYNGYGALESTLNNCTVVQNDCKNGYYGVVGCYATNCIIYSNGFFIGLNYFGEFYALYHCCTYPLPTGTGNFTNAPVFLDAAYHPASNSPCIDAGDSSFAPGSVDLDGRPRIVGAAVDVGAMEFQGASVEPFISWLYQYNLPNDGSADAADSDGTGMNNWQKWIAGLNPTNTLSVLKMSSIGFTNSPTGMTVSWQSVTNVTYYLQRSPDLMVFTSIQSNLVGQAGTTSFIDTTATNGGAYFYRVAVQQ